MGFRALLQGLSEIESFVTSLGRFFKSVDLALPYNKSPSPKLDGADGFQDLTASSDSSDEKVMGSTTNFRNQGLVDGPGGKSSAVAPQPAMDHAAAGYIMHVDCGHKGVLDDVDLRQLSLHLRTAGFGRYPQV